jgi:hypothetical protein
MAHQDKLLARERAVALCSCTRSGPGRSVVVVHDIKDVDASVLWTGGTRGTSGVEVRPCGQRSQSGVRGGWGGEQRSEVGRVGSPNSSAGAWGKERL